MSCPVRTPFPPCCSPTLFSTFNLQGDRHLHQQVLLFFPYCKATLWSSLIQYQTQFGCTVHQILADSCRGFAETWASQFKTGVEQALFIQQSLYFSKRVQLCIHTSNSLICEVLISSLVTVFIRGLDAIWKLSKSQVALKSLYWKLECLLHCFVWFCQFPLVEANCCKYVFDFPGCFTAYGTRKKYNTNSYNALLWDTRMSYCIWTSGGD